MIHYTIVPDDLAGHLFSVTLTLEQASHHQILSLPNWLPGSYLIRDFSKNILSLSAVDTQNQDIPIEALSKNKWQLQNASGQITISYQVYAWDLSVRTAHLDQTHGFFNGSSVFLCVDDQAHLPCTVTIKKPEAAAYQHWQIATGMPRQEGEMFAEGVFRAEHYEALIDYPVEMGTLDIYAFEVASVPHYLVLSGRHFSDGERICRDLTRICQAEIDLFGGQAPFDTYLFLTRVVDQGYGGLEHCNSTALLCARADLPSQEQTEIDDAYLTFLGLCSHEYFHNWNIKRIKPAEFIPYQLDNETYTKQLWAYEGITSYYDDLILLRCGLIDQNRYLGLVAKNITRVIRGQGRFKQTLTESSWHAWTKFYQQDENAMNAIVSYYTKGALFAMYLDLTLRVRSQNQVNLDHLMQELWTHFGKKNIGTLDDTHQHIVEKLTGQDFKDVFAYLDRVDDLPLNDVFKQFGIEQSFRPQQSAQDAGGVFDNPQPKVHWGARLQAVPNGMKVINVEQSSMAANAGISAGDILVAMAGLCVKRHPVETLLQHQQQASVTCHWFRRDELMQADVKPRPMPNNTVALSISNEQKLTNWLP